MGDFTEMHIFFAVTTAVTVTIGILVAYALIRIVRILRNVERLSDMAAEEGVLLRADISDLRSSIRREGFTFASIAGFLRKRATRMRKRPTDGEAD